MIRTAVGLVAVTCCAMLVCGCRKRDPLLLPVTEVRHLQMPPSGTRVPAPRGIAVSAEGELFVADTVGRILVMDTAGKVLRQWVMPETEVGRPENLLVLANGNLVVPDTHYHRVFVFDKEGHIVRLFGTHGRGDGEFIYPVAAAEDPEGNLFICEYGGNDRVQKFSPDGKFQGVFGSFGTGPGQFQRPAAIVWHDHRLYVADAVNHRIQVFSETGEFVAILAEGLELRFPYDLALSPDRDAVYVAEWGAGCVAEVALDGVPRGFYGRPGAENGQFRTPWGVACAREYVYVADTGNRRIAVLKLAQ